MEAAEPKYPLLALSRLRMQTDGAGVTTLVAGAHCSLNCKWCINQKLLARGTVRYVSASELYDLVKQDDLYFRATGGGVTFGGGESLLHADFITAFRKECGSQWQLCAQTALHVPLKLLKKAMAVVDEFIVDVKDLDPEIYRRYTGGNVDLVKENLRYLLAHGKGKRIKLRVPLIPEYNKPEDCEKTQKLLESMGAEDIERFSYVIRE